MNLVSGLVLLLEGCDETCGLTGDLVWVRAAEISEKLLFKWTSSRNAAHVLYGPSHSEHAIKKDEPQ